MMIAKINPLVRAPSNKPQQNGDAVRHQFDICLVKLWLQNKIAFHENISRAYFVV